MEMELISLLTMSWLSVSTVCTNVNMPKVLKWVTDNEKS